MNTLKAIADGWNWKLGVPVEVIATNAFGNAIVRNDAGEFFRIVPEDCACELIARSAGELEIIREAAEFSQDWKMTALVQRSEVALGKLGVGEAFGFAVPSILGGKYDVENIRKMPLDQLLGASGAIARELEGVPDGQEVIIVPKEKEVE